MEKQKYILSVKHSSVKHSFVINMSNTQKSSKFALLSVMLCFFTMGFVDLVGIASNYVQQDLGLTHAQANIMPC